MRLRALLSIPLLAATIGLFGYVTARSLHAETTDPSLAAIDQAATQLDQQIKDKQTRIKDLSSQISKYNDQIAAQNLQKASLQNETEILNNQVAQKQLSIEQTNDQLDALQLEIQQLDQNIKKQDDTIVVQKNFVSNLVRLINQDDRVPEYEILLSEHSLSDFFDQLENTKRLERNLTAALDKVKALRENLAADMLARDDKRVALEAEKKKLNEEQLALQAESNFKQSLLHETDNKQAEFQQVLAELQQQQQGESQDITSLREKLQGKLAQADQLIAEGQDGLNWPIDPNRGITAIFHDPTYPFKNLFPHPGVDIRAYVGTAIHSAGGGYVAWNKTGRMYGNYVMVIHPGNLATVYAHLTQFVAKPDSYVKRGDIIGLSGGMPGAQGAGLSTGPHLHFEVRQNGIPVDPMNYLPTPDTTDIE